MINCIILYKIISITIFLIFQKEDIESEDDAKLEVEELAKSLPQGTDHTPHILSSILSGLPDR